MTTPEDRRKNLALGLMDVGAVQFGAFRLKKHETQPDAPLSPIFFNLRTPENPKQGPLTPQIVSRCAMLMLDLVKSEDLDFDHIAGIPRAGEPFAEAIFFLLGDDQKKGIVALEKTETTERRSISGVKPGSYESGDVVLLIDDLVTAADSKIEAAHALGTASLMVTDIVVLIDREQGGRDQLVEEGIALHAVFTLRELLGIYVEHACITPEKRDEVLAYIEAEKAPATVA